MVLKLCRSCGKDTIQENTALNVFESNNRYLLHKIKILTNVMLKANKNLPKFVCVDCQKQINDAYNFRKSFIQTQKHFKERIQFERPLQLLTEKNFHEIPSTFNANIGIKSDHINHEIVVQSNAFDDHNESENPLKLNGAATSIGQKPITLLVVNSHHIEFNAIESQQQNSQYDIESCRNKRRHGSKNNVQFRHEQMDKMEGEEEEHQEDDDEGENEESVATYKLHKKRKDIYEKMAKSYVCDQCGNHFTTHHYFLIHQRRHTGDKPYACEICTKKFFTDSELMRHMRKHTGEKPYSCRFCIRRFSDCSTRLKHERTHTNERPFACTYCGKSFTTSYILKNHMLIHTGEKLFSCKLCNRSFSRQTHLAVHNRSLLHKQAEEKSKRNACTD